MDFLLANDFPIEGIATSLRAASIGWTGPQSHTRTYGRISIFATDPMGLNPPPLMGDLPNGGKKFYVFDGQFSTDTSYFHPLLPRTSDGLPKRIDDLLERNSSVETINAGIFVAGRIDRDGFALITDPLSQYPLYYVHFGERFFVSNVMRYLTIAMTACRMSPTPSLIPCLESIVFGGTLGSGTPIREVRRTPHGHSILATPNLHFRPHNAPDYPASYEATITGARDALMRHVTAVSTAAPPSRQVIADVTGGSDSRLVLSLLMSSALQDDVRGRCIMQYPHPDANVAGALFARYNLPIAQFPVVLDLNCLASPGNTAQRMIGDWAALAGGTVIPGGPFPTLAFPNLIHFGGSFGELAGGTPAHALFRNPSDLEAGIEQLVDMRIQRKNKSGALDLITKAGIEIVRKNAIAAMAALQDEGVSREQLEAEFYLRTRCRSHFALANWSQNKWKVTPDVLASPWLVAARRALPWRLHSKGKVTFDLLRIAAGDDLLKLPLANKVWDIEIVPNPEKEAYQFIGPINASTPAMSSHVERLWRPVYVLAPSIQSPLSGARTDFKAPARAAPASTRLKSEFNHLQPVSEYRAMLLDLIDQAPAQHDLWSLIDRDAIARFKVAGEFSAQDVVAAGQILCGAKWFCDQPEVTGVQILNEFEEIVEA